MDNFSLENILKFYEITRDGKVFSKRTGRYLNSYNRNIKEINSYERIELNIAGKRKSFGVHRLVAMVYIPNPENKEQVNHINGIKNDNRVENLQWVNQYENMNHAVETGLQKNIERSNQPKPVVILKDNQLIHQCESSKECVRYLNRDSKSVRNCLKGIQKTCAGYTLMYLEDYLK